MLNANDAVARLEAYRQSLGIPAQAVLAFLEKRSIELADRDEIEPVLPVPVPGAEVDAGADADADGDAAPQTTEAVRAAAEAAVEGELQGKAPSPPVYTETLAWVGRFTYRIFFWELALDGRGDLIRLRKSR